MNRQAHPEGALPSFLTQHEPGRAKQWQSVVPYTTTDEKGIHDEGTNRGPPLTPVPALVLDPVTRADRSAVN